MSPMEYQRLPRVTLIGYALCASGGILLLSYIVLKDRFKFPVDNPFMSALALFFIGLFIAGWVTAMTTGVRGSLWRCPRCNARFHGFRTGWFTSRCRNCGVSISELCADANLTSSLVSSKRNQPSVVDRMSIAMPAKWYRLLHHFSVISFLIILAVGGAALIFAQFLGQWMFHSVTGHIFVILTSTSMMLGRMLCALWRCPKCGKRFHGFSTSPTYGFCLNCGASLKTLEMKNNTNKAD
jgi:ribosomal protein S27E